MIDETLSSRVKEARIKLGMTQASFGKLVGASASYLSDVERGKPPARSLIEGLAAKAKINMNWFFTGKGPIQARELESESPQFISIPEFDVRVSAGSGALSESEEVTGFHALHRDWFIEQGYSPNRLSVVTVQGDSMEPLLFDKDKVIVSHDPASMADGKLFVVQFDGEVYVKKVQKLPNHQLRLISENQKYRDVEVDLGDQSGAAVVGKVVASIREWS